MSVIRSAVYFVRLYFAKRIHNIPNKRNFLNMIELRNLTLRKPYVSMSVYFKQPLKKCTFILILACSIRMYVKLGYVYLSVNTLHNYIFLSKKQITSFYLKKIEFEINYINFLFKAYL